MPRSPLRLRPGTSLQALADFLEQKRSAMPRFYFIGDDDLLEILGQAKNPVVIQVREGEGVGAASRTVPKRHVVPSDATARHSYTRPCKGRSRKP